MSQYDNSLDEIIMDMLKGNSAMDYLAEIESKYKTVTQELNLDESELEVQEILEDDAEKARREIEKYKEGLDQIATKFAHELKAHLRKKAGDIDHVQFNQIMKSIEHTVYGVLSDPDFAHIFTKPTVISVTSATAVPKGAGEKKN